MKYYWFIALILVFAAAVCACGDNGTTGTADDVPMSEWQPGEYEGLGEPAGEPPAESGGNAGMALIWVTLGFLLWLALYKADQAAGATETKWDDRLVKFLRLAFYGGALGLAALTFLLQLLTGLVWERAAAGIMSLLGSWWWWLLVIVWAVAAGAIAKALRNHGWWAARWLPVIAGWLVLVWLF